MKKFFTVITLCSISLALMATETQKILVNNKTLKGIVSTIQKGTEWAETQVNKYPRQAFTLGIAATSLGILACMQQEVSSKLAGSLLLVTGIPVLLEARTARKGLCEKTKLITTNITDSILDATKINVNSIVQSEQETKEQELEIKIKYHLRALGTVPISYANTLLKNAVTALEPLQN